MIFPKMMTWTILGKFISRKSNDKVSWKCKKALAWCVMQFWVFSLTLNQKYLWKYVKFSRGYRVVCSFTQTKTPPPNDANCLKSKLRHIFRHFHFTPIPVSPKIPFFKHFPHLTSPNMQRKRSSTPSKFPTDQ